MLLALRLTYEEGLRDHRVSTDGTVECTTDDIAGAIRSAARAEPPDEARLIEILRLFARKGALRMGERDRTERVTPLMVMPGIGVLSPDAWMDQVRAWASDSGFSWTAPFWTTTWSAVITSAAPESRAARASALALASAITSCRGSGWRIAFSSISGESTSNRYPISRRSCLRCGEEDPRMIFIGAF